MQAKLVVTSGASKSGHVTVTPPMTIGRSRDADLTLRHALISRKHCEIVDSDGVLVIRDLGSLNGTYVNSERVNEAVLNAGDELTIGSVTFRIDSISAGQQPVPQGVDPGTGLEFLEPVDDVPTVRVDAETPAEEIPAGQSSVVGTLEREEGEDEAGLSKAESKIAPAGASDVQFEVREDAPAPNTDDSALGSFLKKL